MAARRESPLVAHADALSDRLRGLTFGAPVTHVLNPLEYAREPYRRYCAKYGAGPKEVLLLGMNPGPWGMGQTGIPFGEVGLARDWLGVEGPVEAPATAHPARPIQGFACTRSEVSGARLWGWARERFGTPDRFFARFFVFNYCPLLFLAAKGPRSVANVTPDKLRRAEREQLEAACDEHLRRAVDHLRPAVCLGVGQFAEQRLRTVLDGSPIRIGRVLHPSPASPAANRGWASQAEADFAAAGVALP